MLPGQCMRYSRNFTDLAQMSMLKHAAWLCSASTCCMIRSLEAATQFCMMLQLFLTCPDTCQVFGGRPT